VSFPSFAGVIVTAMTVALAEGRVGAWVLEGNPNPDIVVLGP
jgi:hypothetical protein